MNLKKIEVYGFKSFADRLTIDFNEGVTGIVGPNGCGKSNVVDAIRFVLGEQSPKNLRAGKMTDVIFGGTEKNRKSLSFCQVSLYIDNTQRIFPKSPFDEVIISRKLFKSGQSEYLLNNETVRLKDILDLIRDTGVGKDGYSIVGQGKIDEIMNAKPENRRAIFEDAAGILTYKMRRNETIKKLNNANDSIEKLKIALDGLEKQLGPLAKQREAALKFRDLKSRLLVLETNEFLARSDGGEEEKRKLGEEIARLAVEQETIERDLAAIDAEYNSKTADRHNTDILIGKMRDELTELAVEQEKMLGKGNTLGERIKNYEERKKEEEARSVSLEGQIEKKKEELADLMNHLAMANEDKDELSREIKSKESAHDALVAEITARENEIEAANRAMLDAMASIADIKADKGKLSAEREGAEARIQEVEEEIASLENALDEQRAEKGKLEQSVAKKSAQLDKLKRNKDEVAHEVAKLDLNINDKRRRINMLEQNIAAMDSRSKAVYELGFAPGCKLVSAARSVPAVASKIMGLICDIIAVPEQYGEAIAAALGGALYNVVTCDPADTKVLIDFMRARGLGRATFHPLTTCKAAELSAYQTAVLNERGCLGVASRLIKYDAKYANVISSLLGRTVIVDTYDNAVAINRKYPNLVRMITLGGEMFATTGAITGGSAAAGANRLKSESDIAKANEEVKQKKQEKESLERMLKNDLNDLREYKAQLDEYESDVKAAEVAFAKENERLKNIAAKIDELTASIDNNKSVIEILKGKIKAIDLNLGEIDKSESDVSGARSQADDAAAKHREQFEEKKRTRDRYADELSGLRVELATAESNIQKVQENVDRVKGELDELKASLAECKAKIDSIVDGLEKAKRGAEDVSVADVYKPKLERLRKDISSAEQYRLTIDDVIAKLTARKDVIQTKAVKVGSDKAKKESALERIDDAINTLLERLSEEYMIHSYEEAAAHRVPDFDREAAAGEITRLKREKSALGNVNLDSIQDYDTVSVEYESQKKEYDDLIAARADFEKIINDLSNQMLYQFNTEFAKIQDNFQEIFKELFGGGTGKLELEVPEDGDMLEAGVEIYAQPPGKLLKSMSLLSGGEKALTAIAILFAILRLRPMPFVILDETEAALDDTNVEVFARYLHKFSSTTQFIVVTHRKPTMELADRLYGVTMQEKGVSTVVSVTLSEAVKHSSND